MSKQYVHDRDYVGHMYDGQSRAEYLASRRAGNLAELQAVAEQGEGAERPGDDGAPGGEPDEAAPQPANRGSRRSRR